MIPSLQSNHNITHIFPQFQALLSTQEILVSPCPLVQLLNQPLSQPHGPTLRAVRSSTSTWPASVPLSSRQIINCLQGATWEPLLSSRALRICMILWRGVQTIANLPAIVSINIFYYIRYYWYHWFRGKHRNQGRGRALLLWYQKKPPVLAL